MQGPWGAVSVLLLRPQTLLQGPLGKARQSAQTALPTAEGPRQRARVRAWV